MKETDFTPHGSPPDPCGLDSASRPRGALQPTLGRPEPLFGRTIRVLEPSIRRTPRSGGTEGRIRTSKERERGGRMIGGNDGGHPNPSLANLPSRQERRGSKISQKAPATSSTILILLCPFRRKGRVCHLDRPELKLRAPHTKSPGRGLTTSSPISWGFVRGAGELIPRRVRRNRQHSTSRLPRIPSPPNPFLDQKVGPIHFPVPIPIAQEGRARKVPGHL